MSKAHDGRLLIRWEPQTHEEWHLSQRFGYDIVIEDLTTQQQVATQNVKPLSALDFKTRIEQTRDEQVKYFLTTSRDVMYPDQSEIMKIEDMINSLYKPNPGTADSLRINFLSYFSIFDNVVAESNGLGYVYRYPREGRYKITISVNGNQSRSLEVDTRDSEQKLTTTLTAEFSDRSVDLSWKSGDHIGKIFGYYIEKSEDGSKYGTISKLPIIIPVPEAGQTYSGVLGIKDSLEVNYKDYHYRIRGLDFYGIKSDVYSKTQGYGFDIMEASPLIALAQQENNNDARIDWKHNEKDMRLVEHYRLMRSDSIEGIYSIARDSIDKGVTTLLYPMEYTQNHFRIEAVPVDGNPISSLPVFIMGMDTIAPVTPTVIGATIDSLGRIEVKWNLNKETDLWGYRVFKANFEEEEYALVSSRVLSDTVFIDSTHLDMGIDKVYYMIEACDSRNNR